MFPVIAHARGQTLIHDAIQRSTSSIIGGSGIHKHSHSVEEKKRKSAYNDTRFCNPFMFHVNQTHSDIMVQDICPHEAVSMPTSFTAPIARVLGHGARTKHGNWPRTTAQ